MQTAISDAFLVYRCWIIWNKRWKVVLGPGLLIVGGLGWYHPPQRRCAELHLTSSRWHSPRQWAEEPQNPNIDRVRPRIRHVIHDISKPNPYRKCLCYR